jgi:hypothetical protein
MVSKNKKRRNNKKKANNKKVNHNRLSLSHSRHSIHNGTHFHPLQHSGGKIRRPKKQQKRIKRKRVF